MNASKDIRVYTCTLGRKATQAKYYIADPNQIASILKKLGEAELR